MASHQGGAAAPGPRASGLSPHPLVSAGVPTACSGASGVVYHVCQPVAGLPGVPGAAHGSQHCPRGPSGCRQQLCGALPYGPYCCTAGSETAAVRGGWPGAPGPPPSSPSCAPSSGGPVPCAVGARAGPAGPRCGALALSRPSRSAQCYSPTQGRWPAARTQPWWCGPPAACQTSL